MSDTDHTGPQGAPGNPGVQGVQGVTGSIGIQGIQGVQGDTTSLAMEVGKVAGAMAVVASEVSGMRTEITTVHGQLEEGAGRMRSLESAMAQMVEQQKIANGRTTAMETEQGGFNSRMAIVESKWDSITFVPRMLDKIAEHKVMGLIFTVPLTSALTVLALRVIS